MSKRDKWDIKMLLQVSVDAQRKSNKFIIPIIFDVFMSSSRYDMSYKEYRIYEFHKLDASERQKFLMMSDANRIDKRYNQGPNREIFQDKIKFAKRFNSFTQKEVFDLRETDFSQLKCFLNKPGTYVAKQIKDNNGVRFLKINDETDFEAIHKSLLSDKYYLVEPAIVQHSDLETLYPDCVNTVRVLTFVGDDHKVHVLNVAFKLGNGGIRDNFSRGGLFSVIDENGVVRRPFVNKFGSIYEVHPISNQALVGFQIPFFNDAIELSKKAALEVSGIRYVGWDIAITQEGVRLLDGSMMSKFFQTPPSVSAFVGEEIRDLRGEYIEYMDLKR